jgi:hypothetical protein
MQWLTAVFSLGGGLVAAAVSAFVVTRTSNQRIDADVRARLDAALLECALTFTSSCRRVRHLAERFTRSTDPESQKAALDDAHQAMRMASEQLRLLGNRRVQESARAVIHHAYSVRVQGEEGRDPRASDYPGKSPARRLNDELQGFYRAVRSQLKIEDAENVLHDDEMNVVDEAPATVILTQRSQSA